MKASTVLIVASIVASAPVPQDRPAKPQKTLRAVVLNGRPIINPWGGKGEVGLIGQNGLINEQGASAQQGKADLPYIEIEALAMAVNGTPNLEPTMKLGPNGLMAISAGGCGVCTLAFKQGGHLGKVVTRDGKRYIAVEDVARALGARLGPVTDQGASLIGAGEFKCRECAVLFVR